MGSVLGCVKNTKDTTVKAAGTATDKVVDTTKSAAVKTGDAAVAVKDKTVGAAGTVKDKTVDAAGAVKNKVVPSKDDKPVVESEVKSEDMPACCGADGTCGEQPEDKSAETPAIEATA